MSSTFPSPIPNCKGMIRAASAPPSAGPPGLHTVVLWAARRGGDGGDPRAPPSDGGLVCMSELIRGKFYFATFIDGVEPQSTSQVHYFCTDDELVYDKFFSDFGPLHLGQLYRYSDRLLTMLRSEHKSRVVHYTHSIPEKRANAAFLASAFAVLFLRMSPEHAQHCLEHPKHSQHAVPFKPFQDAGASGIPRFLSLLDCLHGVWKARQLGFFDFADFDVSEFERCRGMRGGGTPGDMSWLLPNKFLAFSGPSGDPAALHNRPEHYVKYFKQNGITAVVRLNRRTYDSKRFTSAGIKHFDLFLADGTCPSRAVLSMFLHIAESIKGAIAVHCKAGLGRTGSLIGAYLMKHYRMTALEAIAWMRVCRPGCVIGLQQEWLRSCEAVLWRMGDSYRCARATAVDVKVTMSAMFSILFKMRLHGDASIIEIPSQGIHSLRARQQVRPIFVLYKIHQQKERRREHAERQSRRDRGCRR